MRSRFLLATFCLFSLLLLPLGALAATIHVPADQPTIQAGINAAASGDTVLVSAGTYYENINFSGKAITVTSASGPAATIIDGSKASNPTVTLSSNEKSTSVLSGMTLRNGDYAQVSIVGSSPTIQGNIIFGTSVQYSYASGIVIQNGSPIIKGNLISSANSDAVTSYSGSDVKITGNLIANNSGNGIYLYNATGSNTIQQNTIIENRNTGVAYYSYVSSALVLAQNLIAGNSNVGLVVNGNGAAVTVVSNTIVDNQSNCCSPASEVQVDQVNTKTTIQNNLFVATGDLPAFSCQTNASTPVFTNNDAFAANNSAYTGGCPDPTGANGNISADPLFVDLLINNYLIQSASPAVNTGNNLAPDEPKKDMVGNLRIIGGTIDMGANEYSAKNALAISSSSLHFPAQLVGTTGSAQTVTLTNNSATAIAVNLIATGLNFSQTNTCGTTLATGASCRVMVSLSPVSSGALEGVLGAFTSATANPVVVELVGTGLAPQVQFNSNFYFYGEVVGTSHTQTGTLTNVGDAPLTIGSIVYSGPSDFVETNNCPIAPNTLAIQASCTVSVTYTPVLVTSESGTVTINDNALPNTQIVSVNGSSVSAGNGTFSPTTLTFPTTLVGNASASQAATLTNTGTGPLGITGIYSYGDFPQTNNCPSSLAVGGSCAITVTYTPNQLGTEYGTLYVYNDSGNSISLQMIGTGEAPVPTITSLSSISAPAGSSDTQITVTGTGFVAYQSQVMFNGVPLPCCNYPNGSTQITVTMPAALLANAGTYQVSVFTGTPGGGNSNSLPFTVYHPVNYAYKSVAYDYRTITGTNLNLAYGYANITSPFPIQFGGGSYTNLIVGEGGTISFSNFASQYNAPIPTTETQSLVAPFWAYLYAFGSSTGTDNNGFWQVLGSAPGRQLVVEWRNLGYCCETTNTIKFQIVFFEGSSNIQFNYANTVFGGSYSANDNGATATSGVQVTSALGRQYSYNQPNLKSQTSLLWYPSSPTATLSSNSLSFGYHQIDTKSLPQRITLTNGGLAPLQISSIATGNPDFTQTNSCGTVLASLKSCVIHVYFTPSIPSAETATLTITDNSTNSPQTASITGIGTITSTVVYPIMANFGIVNVGTTATLPVVLANAANVPLTIQQIAASPSVYTETNNCGTSLAAGASCTVTVTFAPTQAGNISGILSMALNGTPAISEVTLAGSGH